MVLSVLKDYQHRMGIKWAQTHKYVLDTLSSLLHQKKVINTSVETLLSVSRTATPSIDWYMRLRDITTDDKKACIRLFRNENWVLSNSRALLLLERWALYWVNNSLRVLRKATSQDKLSSSFSIAGILFEEKSHIVGKTTYQILPFFRPGKGTVFVVFVYHLIDLTLNFIMSGFDLESAES